MIKRIILSTLIAWLLVVAPAAKSQEPVVGEIIMWAGDGNPPTGWLECNGTNVPIASYPELYDVIGEIYGPSVAGNFTLPDFRARLPVGTAPDEFGTQYTYFPGDTGGEELHTLTTSEMPAHTHNVFNQDTGMAQTVFTERGGDGTDDYVIETTSSTGEGDPHNNMPPYLAVNFIVRAVSVSATPTPTITPTPTATPTPPYGVYTYTLQSNNVFTVYGKTTFGSVWVSGLIIIVVALVGLAFMFGLIYRK